MCLHETASEILLFSILGSWLVGEKNKHMVLGAMAQQCHLGQQGSRLTSLGCDSQEQRLKVKTSGCALAILVTLGIIPFL